MTDDRWVPWPTDADVAERLGITEEKVKTYRLETTKTGNIWRVAIAVDILSPLRERKEGERLPANLILEIPAGADDPV